MRPPSVWAAIVLPAVPGALWWAAVMARAGCWFEVACGVAGAAIAARVAVRMW